MDCALQVGTKSWPEVEGFTYPEVLFMSRGRTQQEIFKQICTAFSSFADVVLVCHGEYRVELECKAINILVSLCPNPHPRSTCG